METGVMAASLDLGILCACITSKVSSRGWICGTILAARHHNRDRVMTYRLCNRQACITLVQSDPIQCFRCSVGISGRKTWRVSRREENWRFLDSQLVTPSLSPRLQGLQPRAPDAD